MTFKRIDDTTIRCIVTEEDLNENGLELDDFFTQSDKAQDFLREIVEQAAMEVGYESHQGMVSLQLMPLPNHALAITFSETQTDNLSSVVESIKGLLADAKEKLRSKGVLQDGDALHKEEEAGLVAKKPVTPSKNAQTGEAKSTKGVSPQVEFRMFAFSYVRDIIEFAGTQHYNGPIESTLYYDKDTELYYLTLEKGRMAVKRYNIMCTGATEFGTFIPNGEQMLPYLQEHAELVEEHRAMKLLSKL